MNAKSYIGLLAVGNSQGCTLIRNNVVHKYGKINWEMVYQIVLNMKFSEALMIYPRLQWLYATVVALADYQMTLIAQTNSIPWWKPTSLISYDNIAS